MSETLPCPAESPSEKKNTQTMRFVIILIALGLKVLILIVVSLNRNRDSSYDNFYSLKKAVSGHPITVEKMLYEFQEIHSGMPFSVNWKNKTYSTPFLLALGYRDKKSITNHIKLDDTGLSIETDKSKTLLPYESIDFDISQLKSYTMYHGSGSICVKFTNRPIGIDDGMPFQTLIFDGSTRKPVSYKTQLADFVNEEVCNIIILIYPDDFSTAPE